MNEIEEIKKQLEKKAIEFVVGGFKPTHSMNESWIGRVYLYEEDEEIPIDDNGEQMIPLFQLCLDNLVSIPHAVPHALAGTKALTVFISQELPMDLVNNGENWLIREYKNSDTLVIKDLTNKKSNLKPFPLQLRIVEKDYPVWDGGGIPEEIEDKILALEDEGEIDSYYDMVECCYTHKLGGYPTFCQSGIDFGNDFEFIFQIASDTKVQLNIVDNGTIFLAKNSKTGEWKFYCDFH